MLSENDYLDGAGKCGFLISVDDGMLGDKLVNDH